MSYILVSMKPLRPATRAAGRIAIAAAIGIALSGCTLFRPVAHQAPPPPPPPAPVVPPTPAPVQTEKFELTAGQDIVGVVQTTTVGKDDTLTDIARRFNVGYEEIVRANPGVDPWLPGAGREIVLPTQFILPNAPHEGVVINVAAMRLFYYPPHRSGEPQVVITHPIGIGKIGWSTPEGVTKIVRRQKDPTWTVPASVIKEHLENGEKLDHVIGPGPDNPLGRHALYLQWPSYLIHGTNKPAGVGLRSSHGCIRLFPEDIAQLFDMVPLGTKVRVVNQPFVFGWRDDNLYMQPFGVMADDTRDWKKAPRKLLSRSLASTLQKQLKAHGEQVNWDLVSKLSKTPRGVPVSISSADASVEQVLAATAHVRNELPVGSTWDGKTDLPMDEATFHQMISEIDPGSRDANGAPGPGVARHNTGSSDSKTVPPHAATAAAATATAPAGAAANTSSKAGAKTGT